MSNKTASLPDGFKERTAVWHLQKFIEFTALKQKIGEPSPHLAIVGYMCRDSSLNDKLWLLGCYAATYCLPTAQVIWTLQPISKVQASPKRFAQWLLTNWKGIITRTERRCVRTPAKMIDCLLSYAQWIQEEFPVLAGSQNSGRELYDEVWESVNRVRYFGRYINIRLIEGLRRYCGIPSSLYDIRSIGGWSPKKCLAYLYPAHAKQLLVDNREGNELTNLLAYRLLETIKKQVPSVDCYVLAAMLCEYKGAFENRHQYPGWTIDQEPLLYDKAFKYWGNAVDRNALWKARAALFTKSVLGEYGGWNGTRWEAARVLRDHGYNWNDAKYDYVATLRDGDFSSPIERKVDHA